MENKTENCATILEIQSTLRQYVVLVSNSHGETRKCPKKKKVSKKIRGLKYFYTNRDGHIIQFYRKVKKYPQPERAVLPSPAMHAHTHTSRG